MVASFQGVGSYPPSPFTAATAASMAVPYPSGIAANDCLLLVAANSQPISFTTPSGWTLLQSNAAINTNVASVYVWQKIAAGSETGTLTVSESNSTVANLAGAILRYNTVPTTGQVAASIKTNSTSGGTTSPAGGTLSPAPGATNLVVRIYVAVATANHAGSAASSAPGGTWVTRLNLITEGTAFPAAIVIADKTQGTDTQTVTASNSSGWMVTDISLVAGVAPPTVHASSMNISQAVKRAAYY